jgi:hypothetical protein
MEEIDMKKHISLETPELLYEHLKDVTEADDITMSQLIRNLCTWYLWNRGWIEAYEFRTIMEECGGKVA